MSARLRKCESVNLVLGGEHEILISRRRGVDCNQCSIAHRLGVGLLALE